MAPDQLAQGNAPMPPMPDQEPNLSPDMNAQPPVPDNGGESEFDTGFDAGVEADEDEDPKKFIQQLTGKLSQSLNTYNNEVGDDEELSKYVGKMIVKAVAKGLDEKGKKELIKSINTTQSDDDEEIEVDDTEGEITDNGDEQEVQVDDTQEEMPVQECSFSKKELNEMVNKLRLSKPKDSPFTPKKFK